MDHGEIDRVATTVVLALGALVLLRLVGGVLLLGLAALPGRAGAAAARAGDAITPVLVRRALATVLGMGAAATAITAPAGAVSLVASAAGVPSQERPAQRGESGPALDPVPVLDRLVSDRAAPDRAAPDRAAPDGAAPGRRVPGQRVLEARGEPSIYVVRRGDYLWRIAAHHLRPGASPAAIDHEWRRWYRLNRAVVGADPDLIEIGMRLVVPGADR